MSKSKKPLTKEGLYVVASLSCLFVIIVITSIANAGLDPTKIFSRENFSNMLINACITVFGTVASIPLGTSSTKQHVNPDGTRGRYLQEFYGYHDARKAIEPRRFMFSQWHHAQFLAEHKAKRVNYLLERSILQAEDILELSREQILKLTESQVYNVGGEDVYFKALSVDQVLACLRVYDGKVSVHKLPDFYFLYIDGKGKRTFYDQAYYESRDENYTLVSRLIYKIFIGFVITCIFTGLIIDFANVEQITTLYVIRALFMLFTRVFNAVSSTYWGYLIGQEVVYKQCYYINGKTQFLLAFDADRDFEYKSVRQIAKEEFLKTQERGVVEEDGHSREDSEL
jgi:hypothetical protein